MAYIITLCREQTDLGPYCLQDRLPKSVRPESKHRDWREKKTFARSKIFILFKIVVICRSQLIWIDNVHEQVCSKWYKLTQGSYKQVCVKFKDFSRTSKSLSSGFKD